MDKDWGRWVRKESYAPAEGEGTAAATGVGGWSGGGWGRDVRTRFEAERIYKKKKRREQTAKLVR